MRLVALELSQRPVRLQAESFSLRGVGFDVVGVGHVGGELEFAAEGVDVVFDEGAELLEEGAGVLLRLALRPIGLVIGAGEGGDGGGLGGDDTFEDDLRRGAGELVARVFGDADELEGGGVAQVLADAEGGALGGVVGEGAARAFEDGVERGEQCLARLAFLLGAAAFAGAGGGDLGLQGFGLGEVAVELGLVGGGPLALGEFGGDFGLGGLLMAGVGEVDGVLQALADEAGLGARGFAGGGGFRGGHGFVWHGGVGGDGRWLSGGCGF